MDQPFEINGVNYSFGKLDAIKQFHVTRRLLPVLAELGLSATTLASLSNESEGQDMMAIVGPVMGLISKMDDADVEYIIKTCMSTVKRQQGDKWAPVQSPGGLLMFADIDMTVMIRLTIESVKENLGGFFGGPPSGVKP